VDSSTLLDEVLRLEKEVLKLKDQFPPPDKRKRVLLKIKKWVDGVLKYWVPLALIIGLLANWWFGVGFFESIQNIAVNKTSSRYYQEIGDKLVLRGEFKAAEESYQTAADINENNINARYGLIRSQVMKPPPGRKTYTPEMVEARLSYLTDEESPLKNDFLMPYYRGMIFMKKDEKEAAKAAFEASKTLEPKFVENYLQLGYLDVFVGAIDKAIANFNQAKEISPGHTLALMNLGACNLVLLNFEKAKEYLLEAQRRSDRLETLLHLGDLYRYRDDLKRAIAVHERALNLLKSPDLEEGSHYGLANFTYMPEHRGDSKAVYFFEQAEALEDYRALVNYALSLDHAYAGNSAGADAAFEEGFKADRVRGNGRRYRCLFTNRVTYMKNFMKVSDSMREWFERIRPRLDPGKECPA
jgi:tetratricopeptide (TPR) repeat protein